jgi:tetratricopeptide (TPR) repeat protein
MTNDVPRIMAGVPELQDEVGRILVESRRLIEGMQRHWLLRKYIKHDSELVPLVPLAIGMAADKQVRKRLAEALAKARQADDMQAVAKDAYNLAVCKLAVGRTDEAEVLNTEARVACRSAGLSPASTYLLESELARLRRDFETAGKLARSAIDLIDGDDKETKVEARIMLATIYLNAGDTDLARDEIKRAKKLSKKLDQPQYSAAIAGILGGIALREGDQEAAAQAFAGQAGWLRKAGEFGSMATALRQVGDIYSNIDMQASAAEYYYRAAMSLVAQGRRQSAAKLLEQARKAGEAAGDKLLLKRVEQVKREWSEK